MPSFLTLNLRFGLANDGPNSWHHRKKSFLSLFKELRGDFICFQEANDFQINFLSSILSEYHLIGKRWPAPSFWQNNVIFFKRSWKCLKHTHFFLSATPDIPSRFIKSRWPRQCTLGLFENNGRKIICVNTHFDFRSSIQVKSAKLILKQISDISSQLPVVLLGDFNSTPNDHSYSIFTNHLSKTSDISPCFKNVFQKPFPGTFHNFTGKPNKDHIDWILYRGDIIPIHRKVITESFNHIYPSDHFPLYSVFRWKG